MFSHILIPADGSPSADSAVKRAIKLAKEMNAGVTGLHVAEPFRAFDQAGKGVPNGGRAMKSLRKPMPRKFSTGSRVTRKPRAWPPSIGRSR
jgi:nucleotide-binding universal stress UspA family protein